MKFPSVNSPVKQNNKKTLRVQDIIEDRRFKGLSDDENSKNTNNRKRSSCKKSQNQVEEQSTDVNSQTLTSEKESQSNINVFTAKENYLVSKKEKLSQPKVVTSHSFKNRNYSKKWTDKETKLFYRLLSIFGTDFSMISLLMSKNRTRSQIINKFHKEEKENSCRVEDALKAHRKCDTKIVKRYIKQFGLNNKNDTDPLRRKSSEQSQNLDSLVFNRGSRNNSMTSVNSQDSVDLVNFQPNLYQKIHNELNGFLSTNVRQSRKNSKA